MRVKKSFRTTKLILLALLIYAIVTVVALQPKITALEAEEAELQSENEAAEQQNLELQEKIDQLGTDEAVKEIARDQLHLVDDNEYIYIDGSK